MMRINVLALNVFINYNKIDRRNDNLLKKTHNTSITTP